MHTKTWWVKISENINGPRSSGPWVKKFQNWKSWKREPWVNFIILSAAIATSSADQILLDATIVCAHCLPIRKQNHSVLKVAPAARSIIKFTQGSLFSQNFLKIFSIFSQNFLKIFLKFSQNFLKIFSKFSQNFLKIFKIFSNFLKISENFLKIFSKFSKIFSKFSQNFHKIFLKISTKFSQNFDIKKCFEIL